MPKAPPQHRSFKPAERKPRLHRGYDRERGSASARGYDRAWQKLRSLVLAEEPLCRFCQQKGILTPAREVDHILTIRERPDLRLVRSNLRALCTPCHSGRTWRHRAAGTPSPTPWPPARG